MLAALASAAMPSIVMAGVRDSERANDTDDAVDMFDTPVAANVSDGEEETFGPFPAGTPTA